MSKNWVNHWKLEKKQLSRRSSQRSMDMCFARFASRSSCSDIARAFDWDRRQLLSLPSTRLPSQRVAFDSGRNARLCLVTSPNQRAPTVPPRLASRNDHHYQISPRQLPWSVSSFLVCLECSHSDLHSFLQSACTEGCLCGSESSCIYPTESQTHTAGMCSAAVQ